MKQIIATGTIFKDEGQITLVQINKTVARKLFVAGETIYLQSCKLRPFGFWQPAFPMHFDQDGFDSAVEHAKWIREKIASEANHPIPTKEDQFESRVNNFIWYNCDAERGKYPHFYKKG